MVSALWVRGVVVCDGILNGKKEEKRIEGLKNLGKVEQNK